MEIKLLTLQTKKIKMMKEFYTQQLGFSICEENQNGFQIQVGTSILEFNGALV